MYIKDALGRVPIPIGMAIVKFAGSDPDVSKTEEFYVYGTERVAMIVPNTLGTTPSRIQFNEATYFLTDHLGNTRVAYMDSPGSDPYIINAVDYYPYGKVLREYDNGAGDRYMTTQHERDRETGLDYRGARYYDSDVARFLSLDPLAAKYPMLSAYNYVAGNPIIFIDPDGKEIWLFREYTNDKGLVETERVRYCDGILYKENGERYAGDHQFFYDVANDLIQLSKDNSEVAQKILDLQDSKKVHRIGLSVKSHDPNNSTVTDDPYADKIGEPTGSTIRYDPQNRKTANGEDRTPRVGLAHELSHSWDHNRGETTPGTLFRGEVELYEVDAIKMENKIRAVTGDKRRTSYMGYEIPEEYLKD